MIFFRVKAYIVQAIKYPLYKHIKEMMKKIEVKVLNFNILTFIFQFQAFTKISNEFHNQHLQLQAFAWANQGIVIIVKIQSKKREMFEIHTDFDFSWIFPYKSRYPSSYNQ